MIFIFLQQNGLETQSPIIKLNIFRTKYKESWVLGIKHLISRTAAPRPQKPTARYMRAVVEAVEANH